jgi:hypothetical protein
MARNPRLVEPLYSVDGSLRGLSEPAQAMQVLTFEEPVRQLAVKIVGLSPVQDSIRVVGHLQVGLLTTNPYYVYWLLGSLQPIAREQWYIYSFSLGDGLGAWVDLTDPSGDEWPILCFGFSPSPSLKPCEYVLEGWI